MVRAYDLAKTTTVPALADAVCVFGVFDGIHRGHRLLLDAAIERAQADGRHCVCITFDIDPDERFVAGFKKIMGNEERIEALAASGIDDVCVLRFDDALARMEPERFLETLFAKALPAAIFVGEDVRFGHAAAGDFADLAAWGGARGVEACGIGLLLEDGQPITSTRIRALLEDGEVRMANALLGHPYCLSSCVVHGRQAGRDMGFRTANLEVADDLRVLSDGVYAARCRIGERVYRAAVSVGVSPTFASETRANVEAHILDFSEDLYGERIALSFEERIRDMRRFADIDELVATVNADFAFVRENLE